MIVHVFFYIYLINFRTLDNSRARSQRNAMIAPRAMTPREMFESREFSQREQKANLTDTRYFAV